MNLHSQEDVEMQSLTIFSFFRASKNSPMQMTNNNNYLLRCLNHTLYVDLNLLRAHLADHNAFIMNQTLC